MTLSNIKIGSNLNFRPGNLSGARPGPLTSSFSRPTEEKGMPRAQNFSVSKLNQKKEQDRAKVSISRLIGARASGGSDLINARVGVAEHRNQADDVSDKRSKELEIIRNKAIERQKFVVSRRLVKERLAREAEEARKAAADKISRQKSRIF